MTPGLVLVFMAALGWAGLDAARKVLVRRIRLIPLLVALSLLQIPAFAVWAWSEGVGIPGPAYVVPALASVALNIAANVFYLRAVAISPLSLTIPLLSFAPVFTALVANPLLGELPGPLQLVGVVAVVIGALLLNADQRQGGGPLAYVRALVHERGSVLMLGTALCWALTIVFDKLALEHTHASLHAVVLNLAIGLVMLGVLLVRRELATLRELGRAPFVLVLAIAIACTALALQLLAIQQVLVAIVEAVKRAVSLGASVVLGRVLFSEPVTGWKLAAMVAMALGTGAIVLT